MEKGFSPVTTVLLSKIEQRIKGARETDHQLWLLWCYGQIKTGEREGQECHMMQT